MINRKRKRSRNPTDYKFLKDFREVLFSSSVKITNQYSRFLDELPGSDIPLSTISDKKVGTILKNIHSLIQEIDDVIPAKYILD